MVNAVLVDRMASGRGVRGGNLAAAGSESRDKGGDSQQELRPHFLAFLG
jgi:hypothetical protein